MEKFKIGNSFADSMKHAMCLRRSELTIENFDDSDMVIYNYYINRFIELQNKYPGLRKKEITLKINSNGGMVVNMFALHDRLKILESNGWIIKSISESRSYSAGFFTLISGTKGYRYAYRNTDLMLHSQNSFVYGIETVADVREKAIATENLLSKLKKVIYDYTDITDEQFEFYIERNKDWYIDAEEALKLSIIDKII